MLAVQFRNRLPDKIINVVSLAAISLPEFFIGYLLILFFAVKLGVATFPATVYDGMGFGERLSAIALPVGDARARRSRPHDAHDARRDPQRHVVGLYRDGGTEGPQRLPHHRQARRSQRAWRRSSTSSR